MSALLLVIRTRRNGRGNILPRLQRPAGRHSLVVARSPQAGFYYNKLFLPPQVVSRKNPSRILAKITDIYQFLR